MQKFHWRELNLRRQQAHNYGFIWQYIVSLLLLIKMSNSRLYLCRSCSISKGKHQYINSFESMNGNLNGEINHAILRTWR